MSYFPLSVLQSKSSWSWHYTLTSRTSSSTVGKRVEREDWSVFLIRESRLLQTFGVLLSRLSKFDEIANHSRLYVHTSTFEQALFRILRATPDSYSNSMRYKRFDCSNANPNPNVSSFNENQRNFSTGFEATDGEYLSSFSAVATVFEFFALCLIFRIFAQTMSSGKRVLSPSGSTSPTLSR